MPRTYGQYMEVPFGLRNHSCKSDGRDRLEWRKSARDARTEGSIRLRSAQHPAFRILSPDKLQGEGNGHPEGLRRGS
jgi:hypothetical protein